MRKRYHPSGRCDELPGGCLLRGIPFRRSPFSFFLPLLLISLFLVTPLAAEGTPGGSGTASSPFPRYQFLETEHFRIIYTSQDRAVAREIEGFAEEVYLELSTFLDYAPPGKIPVLIDGGTDTPNGAFSPAPDRVIILPTPLSPFRLKTLFIHEVVHYIHLTSPAGIFGFLGRIFGDGVRAVNSALIPGWMAEGITVYLETLLTEEGRGRDLEFQAILKGFLYEGEIWEPWQSAYAVEGYPRNRIYLAGYFLVQHLIETSGAGSFMELYRRWAGWSLFSQNLALRKITEKNLEQFHKEMVDSWRKRWADDFTIPEGRRLAPFRSGSDGAGSGSYYPVSVQNRELLFYYFGGREQPGLYSWNLAEQGEKSSPCLILPVSLSREEAADADRDHRFIIFAARSFHHEHSGSTIFAPSSRSDIYLLDRESGRVDQLTREGGYLDPAISDDGTLAAAVRYREGRAELVEFTLNRRGGAPGGSRRSGEPGEPREPGESGGSGTENDSAAKEPVVLASFPGDTFLRHPRISPDNGYIAFTATPVLTPSPGEAPREGEVDIHLLERSSLRLHQLPLQGSRESRPEWTSNRELLFSSDKSGYLAIHSLRLSPEPPGRGEPLDGSFSEMLWDPVGADRAVALPGETAFIYRSYRRSGQRLFFGEAEEGAATGVTLPVSSGAIFQGRQQQEEGGNNTGAPSKAYLPLPLPHTFVPFISLDIEAEKAGPAWGATILAGEATETAQATLQAAWLPEEEQLEGSFSLSHRLFSGTLELEGMRAYTAAGSPYSRSDLSLRFTHPLWSSLGPIGMSTLNTAISGTLSTFRFGDRGFSLAEEVDQLLHQELSTSLSLSWFRGSYPRSSLAFYGGNDLELEVSGLWAPELLDRSVQDFIFLGRGAAGMLPLGDTNIRLTLQGRIMGTLGGGTSGYISYRNSGWNDPLAEERNGRAFTSLSLQIPMPLFEKRILWIPVTRLGLSIHVEGGGTFQGVEIFSLDRFFVAGLELDSRIMVSRIPLPFTIAAAFRIDPRSSFDPLEDLAISFQLGIE